MAKRTGHSTALQAATIAKKGEVGKLLIGHFSSRYKDVMLFEREAKEVFENTTGVNDGDIYSLPLERISTE